MQRHKDPLASVTTVLNRLAEYGEAQSVVRENGRRAWVWASERNVPERNMPTLDHGRTAKHAIA